MISPVEVFPFLYFSPLGPTLHNCGTLVNGDAIFLTLYSEAVPLILTR